MSLSGEEKIRRLQKALDQAGPTHRLEHVVERINDGRAMFWERDDGCIVTEIHSFPLFNAVHYWLVSGALRDCLGLEDRITPWAIENGCTIATASGRPGWRRVLAPMGWREGHTNYVKTLVGT